ncbi:CIS tube protein [Nocardia gipuzkoensis]|uniref:CIS tube protein n=1 Tax=Nocardia TaxID=1817 RepID=UPI001894FD82|nr:MULTISPECIES: LysM peptidoglycan-binding domain-containing protein [Nocardia]MBF6471355.1 LysM peptidoglycan-binding domain-containing protein [Nocardia abscessus]MDE1670433.1 LysM peptidoglycan-binding domain-containing protein [Nocardia gipuzkoensis]
MPAPIAFSATSAGGAQSGSSRPKLLHAFLEVRDPPVEKGSLQPGPRRGQIDFQFNPKELSVTKSAKWNRDAQKGSKKSGVPEFKGADPAKLTLEMFLDAGAEHDTKVVDTVEQLFACCVPTNESHDKKKGSPPWVIFHWGGLTGFTAYVSSVAVKYTLFTPGGLPIRGTATVTIEEIAGDQAKQNPTSGSLTARKVHTVVAGDTLASIAWREYGDPTRWRAVAVANGIDDPMRLRPGAQLLIPAAEELG